MNLLKSGGQVNWRPIFFLLITVCFSWLIGVPQVLMADDQAYSGWQSFQTEYTQIIFEPHNIAYAEDLAGFADGLFEEVSEMVGWKPEKRVPVVLTDRTASANGFYRPLPHSITLFLTSPGDRFLGARSQNWLQSLYVHELVHYIHLTERLGLPGLASYVFGPDAVAANTALMPVWWIEGLAVWAESNLLAGGRGDSPVFNSLWQAPLMEGKMWSRKQMRYQSAYNPLGRVYVSGYLVVDYLVDRYGIEVFRQINKRFIWFPLLGIECAVKHVTGDSLRLAYMRMQGRKRFELRERDFAGQEGNALATQAGSTHREWHVPYSAGDTLLTYSEGTHATAGFVDAKAPSVTLFETGWLSDSLSYSFSRDGRRAVFARISGDYGHSSGTPNIIKGNSDIFLLDMTAGSYEYKKLTHGQRLYQPSISADGSVIVAIELEGDSYRLVKIEQPGGESLEVFTSSRGSVYEPQLHPDGNKVALIEIVDGRSSLLEISLEEGASKVLVPFGKPEIRSPRWTDDGKILFSSDQSGYLALYQVLDGSIELVMEDPVGITGGVSFDNELVYSAYRQQGHILKAMNWEDIQPQLVDWPSDDGIQASEPSIDNTASLEPDKYHDLPRPGFWVPFPGLRSGILGETIVSPGAFWMMGSVLGKHMLSGSLDYMIEQQELSGSLGYQYNQAWGSVAVGLETSSDVMIDGSGQARWVRTVSGNLQGNRLLWSREMPGINQYLSAGFAVSGTMFPEVPVSPGLQYSGQLQYSLARPAPAAAFFGRERFFVSAGVVAVNELAPISLYGLLFGSTGAQIALPWFFHVLRIEADVEGSLGDEVFAFRLLPQGNPLWQAAVAPVKGRATLFYRLPVAPLDLPIPYGGITGAGLSLFAQTMGYAGNNVLAWEGLLYAGAEIAVDMSFLMGGRLAPTLGFVMRIDPADPGSALDRENLHLYLDIGL